MKKFLIVMTSVLVALAFAMPAGAADFKMTWGGYMDVTGYSISAFPVDVGIGPGQDRDSTNSWFQQELVITPTFHINDKVRIHNKITIMERNWGGTQGGAVWYSPGTLEAAGAGGSGGAAIGEDQSGAHNFWWEQCYMSFPLFGGTLSVGRMSGGQWGTLYHDDEDNRDRIKYVRKFGHIVVLAVYEKLEEGDGGTFLPGVAPNATSSSDLDAYAVGAIIPFSKNFIYKPLIYFVDYQDGSVTGPGGGPGIFTARPFGATRWLFLNEIMFKVGPFKFDAEITHIWGTIDRGPALKDLDEREWLWWAEGSFTFGPAEIALGHWYLEGDGESRVGTTDRTGMYGTGNMWEPLLIMYSNDIGIFNDTTGVANAGTGSGASGYLGFYLRGAYNISDSMKLSAIFGYLEADEMNRGSKTVLAGQPARTADKELGQEFDIQFDWKFLPNIKYTAAFAYMWTGDYFDDSDGFVGRDLSNNVYAFMHKLTIEW
jgi:hypothetical protein